MDKVQKIREDVEKLKSQLLRGACSSQIAMETRCKEEAYNEVLAILDTMQEEPVSEDLSEAASVYQTFHRYATPFKAYIDGAKWQEEKDNEEKVLIYKHGFNDCEEHIPGDARKAVEIAREEIYEWLLANAHNYCFGTRNFEARRCIYDLKQAMKDE